jgi:hypothetical protein
MASILAAARHPELGICGKFRAASARSMKEQ